MAYRVRFTVAKDVSAIVAMEPTRFGCANQMQSVYAGFLQRLLREGRALSAVVVNENDEPLAFGLSLFISDHFRQHLLSAQYSNCLMGQEVVAATQRWQPQRGRQREPYPVLGWRDILQAHRGTGLNLLGFYGWRSDLSPDALTQVLGLLYQSFHYLHRGYHLRSFLKEVYGEEERQFYEQLGMRVQKEPRNYHPSCQGAAPYLMSIERGQAAFPLRIADIFATPAPSVRLNQHNRRSRRLEEVGQLAYLLRLTDKEIADCLKVSRNTVSTYWHWMRQRLPNNSQVQGERAGRRACLAYVAHHPEVIYPLSIHIPFYRRTELARQYPLPLSEEMFVAVVRDRYSREAVPEEAP